MNEQKTEYIGDKTNGAYRPNITLNILNTGKVDKSNIFEDGFCDNVSIPLIPTEDEKVSFEFTFCYLTDKCSGQDVYPQPVNLSLIIDDNSGERQYYLSADIIVEDWNGTTTECCIERINPTIQEQAIIELALLKITNPEQFLLKYTRLQVAQNPKIMNRFGFYNDCIDKNGNYRSTWVTEDKQLCILGYVENVKNENSKVQLLQIGA